MTVFILGASPMQLPAIRAAQEEGWHVAVADGNPRAPGAALADAFYPVDLKDKAGLEAVARIIRAERGLDGVFTAGTDFSASVAWVAQALGLPGIPHEVALDASDKLRMRGVFQKAGLPSPAFVAVTSVQAARSALAPASGAAPGLALPLVVKPADNMGARGCRLARTPLELEEAVSQALPFSRSGRAIVEEYMEGPEFSLDALVVKGEVLVRGFADRHIYFAPYFVELGHTMPTAAEAQVQAEVLKVFVAGVKALGISQGAAKGDMKWVPSKGRAMIGEIAARLSGGFMSGWTYPYASGYDLTKGGLKVALGQDPGRVIQDRGWTAAERAFISIPGRVASVYGLRAAEYAPGIKNVFSRVGPGDPCVFPTNNVEKCGNVISQAADRAGAVAAAEAAIKGILVRLEAPRPETEAFLAAPRPGAVPWPPSAFSLGPDLEARLAGLPEDPQVLPPELFRLLGASPATDWAGRTFMESANLALALGLGQDLGPEAAPLPGAFWRAILRGGAQAGLYVLDSRKPSSPEPRA